MKLLWKRTLAGLLACLLMLSAAALPLNALAEWPETDGTSATDLGIQVIVEYTDGEGNPVPVYATPVFEAPNTYWVQVPAEYMGSLTLRLESPDHAFLFTPESGSPLAAMDAGMDLTGPSVMIQAVEEDLTVSFLLYISTMSAYPLMETEEIPEPITEVPVTEVPVTPEPVTEVPVTEVPVTEVPVTEVPVT